METNKNISLKEMIDNATHEDIPMILSKLAKIPSETEKELYIKELSDKLKIAKKAIRADLQKIVRSKILDTPSKETEVYTDKEKSKAKALLEDPKLLDKYLEMTKKVGIVKERGNKLCLYLAYTSRKLKEPISVIIQGQSSTGKSYLSNTILENFIPEDEFFSCSRITPQSLYYLKDKPLSHKILAIFEKESSTRADYSIRTFISEKKLKILCTIKNPRTGEFETKEITIEGPIQYLSTTTKTNIHPDNLTRVFALYVDDSPDKIKASLEAIANKSIGGHDEEKLSAELRIWRCLQTLLLCQKVNIPFAPFLVESFPTDTPRSQRDFQRFLSLIEACALLHQYQREKEGDVIIASVEDYEIAREIGEVVINQTMRGISNKAETLLEVIKTNFASGTFTRADLKNKTGWNYESVRRGAVELLKGGYIYLDSKEGIGGTDNYALDNDPVKPLSLPTKEEVALYLHDKVTKFSESTESTDMSKRLITVN